MSAHFAVLGLARPRTTWFTEVGRWATSGAVPIEFVRCLTAEEVRVRLQSGRPYAAVLLDIACSGVDRDLLDAVAEAGAAAIAIEDAAGRVTTTLDVAARLPHDFRRDDLLELLAGCAPERADHGAARLERVGDPSDEARRGDLVAVTGPGGTGASVLAMGLAQVWGTSRSEVRPGGVVLADLALHADLAMFHAAPDIIPGLSDLVESYRHRELDTIEVRDHAFEVVGRGYDLLLGLRRHRDWAALRPRATAAALRGLCDGYGTVVADVDADIEGEADCGAIEVEERNLLARETCQRADVVVVVGLADLKGTHALARTLATLLAFGVDAGRLLPVVNRAPRHPRRRAEITAALHGLLSHDGARARGVVAGPLFVGEQRRLESALRDGTHLPAGFGEPVARAVAAVLERVGPKSMGAEAEPEAIRPGSLGRFTTDRAAS